MSNFADIHELILNYNFRDKIVSIKNIYIFPFFNNRGIGNMCDLTFT